MRTGPASAAPPRSGEQGWVKSSLSERHQIITPKRPKSLLRKIYLGRSGSKSQITKAGCCISGPRSGMKKVKRKRANAAQTATGVPAPVVVACLDVVS
jgi:hypothetical protein